MVMVKGQNQQNQDLQPPETEDKKGRGVTCVHQDMSKRALCAINAVYIFARHMQQPLLIVACPTCAYNTPNVNTHV